MRRRRRKKRRYTQLIDRHRRVGCTPGFAHHRKVCRGEENRWVCGWGSDTWQAQRQALLPPVSIHIGHPGQSAQTDHALLWKPPVEPLQSFHRFKAITPLAAGVEGLPRRGDGQAAARHSECPIDAATPALGRARCFQPVWRRPVGPGTGHRRRHGRPGAGANLTPAGTFPSSFEPVHGCAPGIYRTTSPIRSP